MSAAAGSALLPADLLRAAGFGLRTRRLRAALSGLGIAIGIGAMVAVVGISASSRADLVAQLDRLGTNLLTVTPGQTLLGSDATLPEHAPAMVARANGVERASAVGTVSGSVRRTDRVPEVETGGIAVRPTGLDLLETLSGTMRAGRFLDAATWRYPAAVLGAVAAERLGIDASTVGRARVYVNGSWFTVVGIVDTLPLAPEIDRSLLVGMPIATSLLGYDGAPSTIYVRTATDAVETARALLGRTANPAAPEEVAVSRPSDALAARAATKTAFTALLLGLGSVALVVGGVGIANVMVMAVLERRSEIGLRRALGATRWHVALQFAMEALLLSALGGAGGVVLGAAATLAYATTRGWSVVVPAAAMAGGVAAAVVTGVVAGSYPSLRAARLSPTEALRTV